MVQLPPPGRTKHRLAEENADLRSRLLSMELAGMGRGYRPPVDGAQRHAHQRDPTASPAPFPWRPQGVTSGIEAGMGVLAGGAAFGTVRKIGEGTLPHFDLAAHGTLMELPHRTRRSCGFPRLGRRGHGAPATSRRAPARSSPARATRCLLWAMTCGFLPTSSWAQCLTSNDNPVPTSCRSR